MASPRIACLAVKFDPRVLWRLQVYRQAPGEPPSACTNNPKSEGVRGWPLQASWARRGAMDGQERRNPIRSPPGMAGVG